MPPRLYTDLAHLWPRLSPPEDYAPEADAIRHVLLDHGLTLNPGSPRCRLIEFGAGGGHTLHHLRHGFDCVAVDLAPAMLEQCRLINPDVETRLGDMRTARFGQTFDAVLIHDAIDYLTTEDELRQTFATAAAHLNPQGVLLVAPTYTRETFEPDAVESDNGGPCDDGLSYTTTVRDPDPADTTYEMILTYSVADPATGQTQTIEDRHTCGLFAEADWLRLLDESGYDTTLARGDLPWTLFVARKR